MRSKELFLEGKEIFLAHASGGYYKEVRKPVPINTFNSIL
jgi:hypothetical protein